MVIDFSKYEVGTEVALKNRLGDGGTAEVMRFRVVRKEKEESTVPRRLSDMGEFEALAESDAARTREFRFTCIDEGGEVMWGVNGEPFDPDRIDAKPRLGSTDFLG